jgi:UDP:flavonoid glycosyltransferase YjiC (YdhE family)
MLILHRYLLLTTAPPALCDPADRLPTTAHPLRPVAYDRSNSEGLPAWLEELAPEPTVYLTLRTSNGDRLDVFAPFLHGWVDKRCKLLVMVGPTGDLAAFATPASNIRTVRYVPQTWLLPRCQAVAFHGGSGTMLSALAHALPTDIVPLAADQPENADRCAAAGVARVLQTAPLSPSAAREAVPKSRRYNRSGRPFGIVARSTGGSAVRPKRICEGGVSGRTTLLAHCECSWWH